uniref:Uncharacterized protein LOC113789484 n=1 Tax=Dermatophagoides pteronyssinus TaxID=6956 RepID=A0A6P6XPN7_DERPT|nr:uncharacterized protein LOC113789484 [Dermatophagoides pteronyssinus]
MNFIRIISILMAGLMMTIGLSDANPVVAGGKVGPHGGGFTSGFAVGRSIALGPGGKITGGGFGPFFGGIPFFFRK